MSEITPANAVSVDNFLRVYRALCPTVDDEVPVGMFAERLGWDLDRTRAVAEWLDDRGLIDTYRGLGEPITVIEGMS